MKEGKEMRILGRLVGIVLLLSGAIGTAAAQDFPTRPIEIYLGGAAGGSSNMLSRVAGTYGPKYLGQQIISVDKPGAAGTIASQFVASAKPDGYTLLMGGGSETIAVGHFRQLPFHPINDFEPIICFYRMPIMLNVKANAPWKTFNDFLAQVKASPGKYSYATSGVGGIYHAAMVVLERQTGINMRHVPFKGGAETLSALLGGHVDVALSSPDEAVALVEAGTIRQLGQFSRTRTPMAPSIPSMAELGYKIYMEGIKGLMAPKGTPKPVIRKLHDGFHKTMEDPGFKSAVAKLRLEMAYLNEEDYGEALRSMYGQIGASLKK